MSIQEFVSHLQTLDVRLRAEGERLRVNAPKGVLTESLRVQITARKQELLEFLRVSKPQDTFIPPPIQRRAIEGPTPLSFAQERLWFLEQLEPGSPVYNISRAFRLTGQLNVGALKASLTEILRRHEILRSQIRIVDGRPVQITLAVSRFEVPLTDLRSLPETEREREVRDRIKAEAEWRFDFSAGLFLRAVLFQISHDQHILVLTTHHIVSDAWSMGILTRELWAQYQARTNGKPLSLQELPVQYTDYAVWQREWLQADVLEAQLSYWRKQLENIPMLNLPTDRTRPAKQSFRGARQPISLPQSLTTAVNELSGREGVTQFMTLLAVFQVLLYRYSGQEDVVVGSPIANRNDAEIERLIGFFVNTLVLRSDCSGEPSFREFLLRVRDVCLAAYTHQNLPFEKLVEELRPDRDLSRNPLFQVMFVLQNTPRRFPQPSGLSIERVEVLPATSPFDLSLYLRERDRKLIGFFEYGTDLFDSSTIERMIGHFRTLLEGIVTDPDQSISTLPLLTEVERHELLVKWNDTKADYPKDSCIHELFEAQVERTPEAVAVRFEGEQLTYRELNRRSNQRAHYVRSLGIGPEKLVGICIERSTEMVIGLLGILKAGGAYVPLDPSYPRERLSFMIEDSQVSVLLTTGHIIEGFKIGDSDSRSSILDPQIRIVCLDTDWESITGESEQNPRSEVKPDNLAYVIYTSGSTGRPKGVAMAHRSLQNLISWQLDSSTTKAARTLQFTSLSFDVSFQEMFSTWCSGGTLILISEEKRRDIAVLMRELRNHSIERLFLPFMVLQQFAEMIDDERANFTSLREIITAGEQLQITPQIRRLFKKLNVCRLHNQYGPAETHVVTSLTLEGSPDGWVSYPAIGRPIANAQIYVLDSRFRPVPIGVPGELYIGGAGLARGYLNRVELTAERFFPNPFLDEPEARIYRSGDLARYLPNGNVELLGRVDNQVKIRGYRIELGEIEAVLSQHPTVKNCIVVVREHDPYTEKKLACYVVLNQQFATSVIELRDYLRGKLPEYMVPSVFAVLDALPLMPNGKVDRQNLPSPEDTRFQVTEEFVAPRTEIEELIAQTWREVLKLENVGIYDNFFELGGHSLLATQIASRLRNALAMEIPVRVLFDQPTIAELSKEIENLLRDEDAPKLPPIVWVPRDGPLPLSINQEHLWRLDRMFPGTHFFNMPYVYRLSGDLNVSALEKALQETITRHEVLRTVFAEIDGRPAQIIKEIPELELPYIDLRGGSADDVSERAADLLLEEREAPFDLAAGPLLRTKLLRLSDTEYLLLVTMQHIISDEWSMRLFFKELTALYETYAEGRASPLCVHQNTYIDYACWERRLLNGGLFDKQIDYWRKQLTGSMIEFKFKNTRKRTKQISFRIRRFPIEFTDHLFSAIKKVATNQNYTPFIIMLSALNVLLHHWTGQRDIRIGTLVANRTRQESEHVIGHFINTVVLRNRVNPRVTFRQLIGQVGRVFLSALTNQELPFEHLARVLTAEREIRRASLFQVMVIYHKRSSGVVNLPGITFAPLGWQQARSNSDVMLTACDLVINMWEMETKITGSVNYKTDTFGNDVVAAMLDQFATILKQMVADTGKTIASISYS